MKRIIIVIFSILVLFSCKKDNNSEINPPGDDSTFFSIPQIADIVMYEVNLRALSASGDIQGVINRLEEIKELGINVIWLMPIHPIGEINSVNSPYSVKNYKEVNPEFGTMNDLKTLVNEAHKKGIAIILDWVANHTAWDNPWITNKDWYSQDGNGNIISPPGTNWADVADLDYSSQEMRDAMIEAMKYWVTTADIDGFRCDAADMIPFDFWTQAIDSISGVKDSLIWLAEGSRTDHYTAGFHMTYSWTFYERLKAIYAGTQPAASLVLVHNQEYNVLPEGKHKLRFTTNHDESAWDATPMVIFNGEAGALAASVAAIYLGGVPLIYGSQEVGVEETVPFFSNDPIDWAQHPEMLKAYQDLLKFYNTSEPLRQGTLTSYSTVDVLAFKRASSQGEVFVMVNLRDKNVSYDVPSELENTAWKDAFTGSGAIVSDIQELMPYQYFIYRN